ncbi:hypothetical protein JCM10450v2_008052 [Rhodotorula kratochvilovae]
MPIRTFMDFAVEGEPLGRVVFELFDGVVPKTCENFRALCTGSKGVNELGIPLWYKGSILHRVIAGFMVQGGDFTQRNGKGGESIYGGTFEDESLKREIDEEGLLCMANRGKNTNGSQWFVSLRPCPHLAGKHVVFGKVVKGYEIIVAISKLPVDEKDRPISLVTVSHCGELERKSAAKPAPPPSPSIASSRSRSRSVSRSPSRSRSRSRSLSPDRHRSKAKRSSRSHSRRHEGESGDERSGDEAGDDGRKSSRRHRSHHHRSSRRHRRHRSRTGDKEDKEDKAKEGSPELSAAEVAALQARAEKEARAAATRAEEEAREAERKSREAREKREQFEREVIAQGGIIYKGSGRMKAGSAPRRGGMRGW